jgi:hypothetical protein
VYRSSSKVLEPRLVFLPLNTSIYSKVLNESKISKEVKEARKKKKKRDQRESVFFVWQGII